MGAGLKIARTRGALMSPAADFDDIRMEEEVMLDLTGYTFKGEVISTNTKISSSTNKLDLGAAGKTIILQCIALGTSAHFVVSSYTPNDIDGTVLAIIPEVGGVVKCVCPGRYIYVPWQTNNNPNEYVCWVKN